MHFVLMLLESTEGRDKGQLLGKEKVFSSVCTNSCSLPSYSPSTTFSTHLNAYAHDVNIHTPRKIVSSLPNHFDVPYKPITASTKRIA
jgi:hypothetical protein